VLRIARSLRAEIVAHARRDHPDEACGILAGPVGSDEPRRFVAMVNAERSPTFFRFDNDEQPVVIYHSHTATPAYPSRTDIALAAEPDAHYVVVSTRDGTAGDDEMEFRSFRIVEGEVTEEEVEVVADAR
jgi:[CysO sulfur-carrier protein]-S-L-cysteine hydrolase